MSMFVDEALCQSVLEVVYKVAESMVDPEKILEVLWTQEQHHSQVKQPWNLVSVANGYSSQAIFFGQMDRCFPNRHWDQIAHTYLMRAARVFEAHSAYQPFPGLFTGLTGLCFATHFLSYNGTRYKRLLGTLDDALIKQTMITFQNTKRSLRGVGFVDYDLISGPSGIGAYLLLRREMPGAEGALQNILDWLLSLSEEQGDQLPFFIPPERQVTKWHRTLFPHGSVDCGLAHGVAGPLAFFALAQLYGIERPNLKEALQRLSGWIVAHGYDDNWGVTWPGTVTPGGKRSDDASNRASWCYGSPGIARALWMAGQALQETSLQQMAVEAMRAVYRRPIAVRGLKSPILCHGVAGLLQITLRFVKDSNQPFLNDMAAELTQQLIDSFEPSTLFGFRDTKTDETILDNPGLLEGSAGIALTLLTGATDVASTWDRLFLLS